MLSPVKLWILVSALASAAGWMLSAIGQLNGAGYAVIFILAAGGLIVARKSVAESEQSGARVRFLYWPRLKRRFRRPLAMVFLVLALLVLIAGAVHPPSNYDALTYRIPRVLHWLGDNHWSWVHTQNVRLNTRVCGIEWLSAPVVLLFRTDRGIFLINLVSFLLLPGLLYGFLTRLNVRPRVAWFWMWLLPTGYNFALQAGSVANDTFAAVYALAAVDFALRARVSRRVDDVWFSLLAAALLTGSKLSNLPLLLPWAVALLPSLRLLLANAMGSAVILSVAALVSFVPTTLLNLSHGANWSGASLEDTRFVMKNPLLGVAGNSLILVHQNFAPPFFPWASAWNEFMPQLLPGGFRAALTEKFESGFLKLGELPSEETAGLGLGVSGLVVLSVLAARRRRADASPVVPASEERRFRLLFHGSSVIALLVFMSQSGLFSPARIISPYYPFLLAPCLFGVGHVLLVRARWWRRLALLVGVISIAVVVLTPSRPLWPAQTVLASLQRSKPDSRLLNRASAVYSVYANRADSLAPLRQWLPADATRVGFISSGDDPETSLWRPFGRRHVIHILPPDDVEELYKGGLNYVVIGSVGLKERHHQTIEQWLERHRGQVVGKASLTVKVAEGVHDWYVVRLDRPADERK